MSFIRFRANSSSLQHLCLDARAWDEADDARREGPSAASSHQPARLESASTSSAGRDLKVGFGRTAPSIPGSYLSVWIGTS